MEISNYAKAGYGMLFIETTEIKRAMRSINAKNWKKVTWDSIRGLTTIDENGNPISKDLNQLALINEAKQFTKTMVIAENFDAYLSNPTVVQSLLNAYEYFKATQTCFVIVGIDSKKIPPALKEFVQIIEFAYPTRNEIKDVFESISKGAKADAKKELEEKKISKERYKEMDFSFNEDLIEASLGLTYEEIENALSYCIITYGKFNKDFILGQKKKIIKETGFMEFIHPEPIENLGGLENIIDYVKRRLEPFQNPESIKPKLKGIMAVGVQGCGKSLIMKVLCSLTGWPGIMWDLSGAKAGIVGETEANMKRGTKLIDAFGKCIVGVDEVEKQLAGGVGNQSNDSGVSAGQVGHLLTWMQERESDGIIYVTANRPEILPPEFLRAGGRFDSIWFIGLPNPNEIKQIIEIKNRIFKSNIPNDDKTIERLWEMRFSGAEIEQLAKDLHFEDDLESAIANIPILAQHRADEIDAIIERCKYFRKASKSFESSEETHHKKTIEDIKRKLGAGSVRKFELSSGQ